MSRKESHAGLVTLLAFLLFSSWASAQPAEPQEPVIVVPSEGTELFRHLVHTAGFRPYNPGDEEVIDPSDLLLVVLGDPAPLMRTGDQRLQRFLEDGGAVLVATDRAMISRYLRINIAGRFVEVNDESQGYRRSRNCPIVEPIGDDFLNRESPRSIFALPSPLRADIATNNPSAVRILPRSRGAQANPEPLARYPSSARFIQGRDFNRDQDLFGVGGKTEAGRFLVLGDHSVFINRMMRQKRGDTGNEDFARNCLVWLREKPDGVRTRCLFYEDNQVQSRFDLPVPPRPDPPFDVVADTVLNHGNEIVRELEDRDFFNQALLDEFGLRPIIRFILIMLTVLAILYGFFKIWGARTGPNPGTAILNQALALAPRGSAVRQRTTAQLDSGNLYELARDRVREKFDPLGGSEGDEHPPRVVVSDEVSAARRLRKSVEHLWRIGYGAIPLPVRRRDWAWFNAELDRAARAGRAGRWRFELSSDKT